MTKIRQLRRYSCRRIHRRTYYKRSNYVSISFTSLCHQLWQAQCCF